MKHIIQQITTELVVKILEKVEKGEIKDIDRMASDVLLDCKTAAKEVMEAVVGELNLELRENKELRKEQGLVLKEKERKRNLLTELGMMELPRDYYYDKKSNAHVSPLDFMVGIPCYQRIGDSLRAKLVSLATDVSYAKSTEIACMGMISRQSVKNSIVKAASLKKEHEPGKEKRKVKELHVYADEDHVHLQKPGKQKGKANQIVPLVTVTEGTHMQSKGRHRTLNAMHFVDEKFNTKELWKEVEGYIDSTYEMDAVETIYLHADGGMWIESGLEVFSQRRQVMDGYHLGKRLKQLEQHVPKHNARRRITEALRKDNKIEADRILQSLYPFVTNEKSEQVLKDTGKYLMEYWDRLAARMEEGMQGSCTEGLISHVLSERFSRDPLGWGKEGLGKLTVLRAFVKNGGKIDAEAFREQTATNIEYKEYADKFIAEVMEGAKDWSVFEKQEAPIYDKASGTQILLSLIGRTNTLLFQ